MKLNVLYSIALIGLAFVACTSDKSNDEINEEVKPTEEALLSSITEMHDSIMGMQGHQPKNVSKNLIKIEYINRLLDYYRNYPEGDKAAECLDKVHMTYSGISNYEKATQWADTILEKYPNYVNRPLVLESQASSYDALIDPRDSSKVRMYYTKLLEENPDMDAEKKEGIQERLKFNHLDFDAYIEHRIATQLEE